MMKRGALSLAALLWLCLATPAGAETTVLSYVSPPNGQAQRTLLRRRGAELQLVDAGTQALLAHAPAAAIRRVSVRGADQHDDALTLDLSEAIELPDGIDYDGGSGGWDTLEIRGGRAASERITQRTPHDGLFEIDGLAIRYTNLEPVVDTVPTVSLTINGTPGMDTVTVADGPGAGQTTISSPTFESYTFANKTHVVFDGQGGGDTVNFDNPNSPTGLQSFIVQNVASLAQTAPFAYPAFGASASGTIRLLTNNTSANVELVSQGGDIAYFALGDVTIGGVSASLAGVRVIDSGDIVFGSGGALILADTDAAEIVRGGATSGDVMLNSATDISVSVDNAAVVAPAGLASLHAVRDVLLGTNGDFKNDVLGQTAAILQGDRDVVISGSTTISSDAANSSAVQVYGGRDVQVSNATGTAAKLLASGANSSVVVVATSGAMNLSSGGPSALQGANVALFADRLIIGAGSGVDTGNGFVQIATFHAALDLGSVSDSAPATLELSNAEANRIAARSVLFRPAAGQAVSFTQPISVPYLVEIQADGVFTASGGGSLSTPTAVFLDLGNTARVWTASDTGIAISPGATIPLSGVNALYMYGGNGSDTFNLLPSTATALVVFGGAPTPPALPGDTLRVTTAGTGGAALSYAQDVNGYSGAYTFSDRIPVSFNFFETIAASTDLSVSLAQNVNTPTPGDALVYTLVAANKGTLGIEGARVGNIPPSTLADVRWTCAASAGSTCGANGVGNIDESVDLAAGGTATFTVVGTVPAMGVLTDTATIAPPAGVADPNPANDSAAVTATVNAIADLAVVNTAAQATYTRGGTINYTIVVANNGPDPVPGVALTDVLPANTTFAMLSAPPGFDCTTPPVGGSGTIMCNAIGSLAVSSNTFLLRVRASQDASGAIANTASLAASGLFDPDLGNNSATATVAFAAIVAAAAPFASLPTLLMMALVLLIVGAVAMRRSG